jgi:hypothetical protein
MRVCDAVHNGEVHSIAVQSMRHNTSDSCQSSEFSPLAGVLFWGDGGASGPVWMEIDAMIGNVFRGSATGVALAFALLAVTPAAHAADKKAAAPAQMKLSFSKPFQAIAAPLSKAMDAAKARADIVAASNTVNAAQTALQNANAAGRAQARTNLDAAVGALGTLLAAEKTQLDAAFAAVTSPDDRYMAGSLAVTLGGLAKDTAIQRKGLEAMIASGKPAPADLPRLQYYLGQFAFDAKDYATARTMLQSAVSAGFHENDADALLAEAFISDNQAAQGLTVLKQAIDYRNSTPNKAPANWYRRGLGAAYKAKLLDQAADFAMSLVSNYPTKDNWAGAITVVREIGRYPAQETLDLMRLMDRTKSYAEERDYIEYIQAADARRLPGEVIRVLDTGQAAGKLRASDVFIAEARSIASGRIAADRATLPNYERDARAANATAVIATGAADTFLSYGDAAKAEALYTIALGKAGGNTPQLLNRLGIAQIDQGNFAAGQATLAKVTGPRGYIAKLWAIYAAQKAAAPAS